MIKTNFAVLMAERGLKIADVYEETGISKTTLMALADNTGKGVQFDTVDKLCNYFGVEIKDFFVYVPYIWEMYFKEDMRDDCTNLIVVKLKTKNSEKDYFLEIWSQHPKNYNFPIDDDNIKLWLTINLQQSDAYDYGDFYDFIIDLPVSMSTIFYNQIVKIIKSNLLNKGSKISVYYDSFIEDKYGTHDTITIEKDDRVYLSFFGESFGSKDSKNKLVEKSKFIMV